MNIVWIKYLPKALQERIERHEQLKMIIGNTGWLFAEKFIRLVAGVTVSVWVARYLGPEKFGALSYATSFVLLFSAISQLGLDTIVVRNLVRTPDNHNELLGTAFLIKMIGSVVAFIMILLAIRSLRPNDSATFTLVLITASGTLFQAFSIIDLWFQSQMQAKYPSYVRTFALLLVSGAKIVLIITHAPLVAFVWAVAADFVIGSVGLIFAYRINGLKLSHWRASRIMGKNLLQDSWPLMFSDILVLVYMRIDKIMIGEMAGTAELGVYSVAALITETLFFIPTIVTSSLFPSIVEAKDRDTGLFHSRLQRLYNLMVFLAYSVAIPVTFLAGWFVPLVFGANYNRSVPMLIGLAWASTFIYLMIARSYFMTVMNWTRLHFVIDIVGCILNVTLYYLLIPRFGGMGAVAASFVAYWFLTHALCFVFQPLRHTGFMMTKALLYPKFW